MIENLQIHALKIPSGWYVEMNHFYDLSKTEFSKNSKEYWSFYIQDMLFIKHISYKFYLFLGWYPENDSEGEFRLVLEKDKKLKPLRIYKTVNEEEVIVKIEEWLFEVNNKFGLM